MADERKRGKANEAGAQKGKTIAAGRAMVNLYVLGAILSSSWTNGGPEKLSDEPKAAQRVGDSCWGGNRAV